MLPSPFIRFSTPHTRTHTHSLTHSLTQVHSTKDSPHKRQKQSAADEQAPNPVAAHAVVAASSTAEPSLYTCHECEFRAGSHVGLSAHLRTHTRSSGVDAAVTNGKSLKCQLCPQTFSRRKELAQHVEEGHPMESSAYPCSKCDYSAVTKTALRMHMRKHDDAKPFVCTYAGCEYVIQCPFMRRD